MNSAKVTLRPRSPKLRKRHLISNFKVVTVKAVVPAKTAKIALEHIRSAANERGLLCLPSKDRGITALPPSAVKLALKVASDEQIDALLARADKVSAQLEKDSIEEE